MGRGAGKRQSRAVVAVLPARWPVPVRREFPHRRPLRRVAVGGCRRVARSRYVETTRSPCGSVAAVWRRPVSHRLFAHDDTARARHDSRARIRLRRRHRRDRPGAARGARPRESSSTSARRCGPSSSPAASARASGPSARRTGPSRCCRWWTRGRSSPTRWHASRRSCRRSGCSWSPAPTSPTCCTPRSRSCRAPTCSSSRVRSAPPPHSPGARRKSAAAPARRPCSARCTPTSPWSIATPSTTRCGARRRSPPPTRGS